MVLICFCGGKFGTVHTLHEHAIASGHFYRCAAPQCGSLFLTLSGTEEHQKRVGHCGPIEKLGVLERLVPQSHSNNEDALKCPFCGPSKKPFKDAASLMQHKSDKHPTCSTCPTCNQVFDDRSQQIKHQKDVRHCCCLEHNIAFTNIEDFNLHTREELHTSTFQCMDCGRQFGTQQGIDDHLPACPAKIREVNLDQSERARAALAAVEEANLQCQKCNRTFKDLNAFRQHKGSIAHNPLTYFTCSVLPGKCNQAFTSYSAWFFHIESGKCKSGINRKKLYNIVHIGDTQRLVTYASNAAGKNSISDAGLCSHASITESRVSDLDTDFDRLSISESSQGGIILTPDSSDHASETSTTVGGIITPTTTDTASDTSSTSGVLLTPRATASRSRSSFSSDMLLTPKATTNSRSEWSFVTDSHKFTPVATSINGSSTNTITHENLNKHGNVWACAICSRIFPNKTRFLQHRNSPVHDPKLFHCPPRELLEVRRGKPEKAFKTLSGFAQHVEAGACDGGTDLLKTFVDICQDKSKIVTAADKKLIGSTS